MPRIFHQILKYFKFGSKKLNQIILDKIMIEKQVRTTPNSTEERKEIDDDFMDDYDSQSLRNSVATSVISEDLSMNNSCKFPFVLVEKR